MQGARKAVSVGLAARPRICEETGFQILLNDLFQLLAFHRAPPRVFCPSVGASLNLHNLPYATSITLALETPNHTYFSHPPAF